MGFLGFGKNGKEIDVPPVLPDTVMDRLSSSQGSEQQVKLVAEQPPQPQANQGAQAYVDAKMQQFKDTRRIPEEIMYSQAQDRSRADVSRVLPMRADDGARAGTADSYEIDAGWQGKQQKPHRSFFDELMSRFKHERHKLQEIPHIDLLGKMRDYHDDAAQGGFMLHESDADGLVFDRLTELKELELEWLMRKKEYDAANRMLHEKEAEIQSKLGDFKNTLRSTERFRLLNMPCLSGREFNLAGGGQLRTLQDLFYALQHMSDEVFRHHVNAQRNDFANWIRNVFGNAPLADAVQVVRDKQELITLLKSF